MLFAFLALELNDNETYELNQNFYQCNSNALFNSFLVVLIYRCELQGRLVMKAEKAAALLASVRFLFIKIFLEKIFGIAVVTDN